jgi:hypothetical protein
MFPRSVGELGSPSVHHDDERDSTADSENPIIEVVRGADNLHSGSGAIGNE